MSLPPTQSPWNVHVTFLPDPRPVLSLLCPSTVRYSPPSLIFVGFILCLSHLHRVPYVASGCLSSLPCPRSVTSRVYVLLMPWKPQKFQRFSRLAPTPVSSCLKVQGSRERRASTSPGLICRRTHITHARARCQAKLLFTHKLTLTFSHILTPPPFTPLLFIFIMLTLSSYTFA